MNYYLFASGLFILLMTAGDLVTTALSVRGAGFLSKRVATGIWKIFLFIAKHIGTRKLLEMGGATILLAILVNWLLLIWLSASLLFISDPHSLINVETNTAASIVGKIFYTGYTLSTLGLGDMEPDGDFWEVLTAILSFAGLILISIAITYLIPVVSAEIQKRRISVYITTLGCSIEEILLNYWDGHDFKQLEQPFINLTNLIILHTQNHKAYSVLHFFHTSDKKEAFVLNLTNLDEVLTILFHQIEQHQQPAHRISNGLRRAISGYLNALQAVSIKGKDLPPRHPLDQLLKNNITLITGPSVDTVFEKLASRRKLLLALVKDDGWEWHDLDAGSYDHENL